MSTESATNAVTLRKAMLNLLEDARELELKLQYERDRIESIFSAMAEGLVVVAADHSVIMLNPAAAHMLGTKAGDAVNKDIKDLLSVFKGDDEVEERDRPTMRTLNERVSITTTIDDDFYFKTASGRKFPVTIATSPVIENDNHNAIIIFRDVTREKELENAKSSFISTASHQLRTPLTSIRWYAEMLTDEDVGVLNKEQRDFAREVYDGATRLNDTINTLLSISRIESGKLHEEPVDIALKPFVKNITDELALLIAQKKLFTDIRIGDDARVTADTFMLHEVISNLLSNSIRYTNEDGHIAFSCDAHDGETVCSIADDGIGIPDDQKGKIFDRFFRAGNAMSKVPDGSGLGLNLVKQFVEKWGGRIWFESTEGKGSVFHFTIPATHKM